MGRGNCDDSYETQGEPHRDGLPAVVKTHAAGQSLDKATHEFELRRFARMKLVICRMATRPGVEEHDE
jgi:hypothetical protein